MFLLRAPSENLVSQFIAVQRNLPFSYPEVGATRDQIPGGYNIDQNRVELGRGKPVFDRAVAALKEWKQFDLGWVKIVPEKTAVEVGATVAVRAYTFGMWSLSACRVIYVLDEDGAQRTFGFAYGTLPDHVERGEERFTIEWQRNDDTVWYDILAFSQPNKLVVKLASPLTRRTQKRFARESLRKMIKDASR